METKSFGLVSFSSSKASSTQPEVKKPKVLLIDNDPDRRRERIGLLMNAGFNAQPALNIEQARSRCQPGRHDLIIVNALNNETAALQLCDDIRRTNPKQRLLMMAGEGSTLPARDFTISDHPSKLLEEVKAVLKPKAPEMALAG